MSRTPARAVVHLLSAQALAFGVTLALLVIPANALFLDAYGSEWLPATYIAIAIVGSGASALIARAARRTRLARVATAALGSLALLFGASWVILVSGGVWVSAVLLVLFPIALQIGFVFIGGQAGRLLDVRQMKELFPRVVSGFAVGFLLGGLLAIPLLALLGSTKQLLLATTVAQLAFLGLLLVTERRFPEIRDDAPAEGAPTVVRPPLRTLFVPGLVLLLLTYQVLSAMGSQVVDFLLFDRAAAQYSGDDLTRFLSTYTAVLNLVDILFLAVLAGPLMRRFGLRLGLTLNPAVVAGILAVMAVVAAASGSAAFGLLVLAGVLRIADIAATDGTTRTSINAAYQIVPAEERLAVQSVVEGIGVPVAIGATGVLLLFLSALDLGTNAVIAFGLGLSVVWTAVAVTVYRSYTRALANEVRRSPLPVIDLGVAASADVRALLRSEDARDVRLGLDLLAGVSSPVLEVELRHVAAHSNPEVRVRALGALAESGDSRAAAETTSLARELARSDDPASRRAAAAAFAWRGAVEVDRALLASLLGDPDLTVRAAALDAVAPDDAIDSEIVHLVVAAVRVARIAGRATAALGRLGETAVAPLGAEVARGDVPRPASLVRAAAAMTPDHGIWIVQPALDDRDRVVVLAALDSLDAARCGELLEQGVLEPLLLDATALAERAYAARAALADYDASLVRALDDEIDLARRLVIAVLALRHGEGIRAAVRVVDCEEGQRRALAIEALDVALSRREAAIALPLVSRDLTPRERAADSRRTGWPAHQPEEWIADIAEDPEGVWRSPWLTACALDATER